MTISNSLYVHEADGFSLSLPTVLPRGKSLSIKVKGINLSYTGFLFYLSNNSIQMSSPKYTEFLAGGDTFKYGDFDISIDATVKNFINQECDSANELTFLMPKYSLKMKEIIFKSVSIVIEGKETDLDLSKAKFWGDSKKEFGDITYIETNQKNYDIYSRPFNVKDETYAKMINASLVSKGNNWRMKKVIEKIRKGETVYYTPLGGSITEGGGPASFRDGYAYQFHKKLQAALNPGGSNILMNPCGPGGTGSAEGVVRYAQNVIEKTGHAPDLLIIEFAVNDEAGTENIRGFEELIRKGLSGNPECAVIGLYSAAPYTTSQVEKIPVGEHYGIQQVSIQNAVDNNNGEFDLSTDSVFYVDYVHPSTMGHTIMTDCLMNLINQIDKDAEDTPNSIPADYKVSDSCFSGFTQILPDYAPGYKEDSNVKLSCGSFTERDFEPQHPANDLLSYPYNWMKPGRVSENLKNIPAENDAFRIELDCKNILIIYKGTECGTAEVLIDGKVEDTLNGSKESWNTSNFKSFIKENECKHHVVEIRMASGDEAKPFTIEGIAYSK